MTQLAEYLRECSGEPIDEDFLKRIQSLPPSLLSSENTQVAVGLDTVRKAAADAASKHIVVFTKCQSAAKELSELRLELDTTTRRSAERAKSVPAASSQSFELARAVREEPLRLYSRIDQIQDFIGLPELVNACVAQGNYSQVLDLAGLAARLHGRYPGNKTVVNIFKSVDQAVESLKKLLTRVLRESGRLSQLVKAVSFLRRMGISDKELHLLLARSRLSFLERQWTHLGSVFDKERAAYVYLKRYIELFREHVFATISAYNTIFGDHGMEQIARFVRTATFELLETLKECTPRISSQADLSALYLQLAYCAQSLGRVGADFTPLLKDVLSASKWKETLVRQQEIARPPKTG